MHSTDEVELGYRPAKFPAWVWLAAVVILGVGSALFYVRIIEPWIVSIIAQGELNKEPHVEAPIVAQNTEMISWPTNIEELPPGVNPQQLSLGRDGVSDETAVFVFASELSGEHSLHLDVYLDFYSQRGRDFFVINKPLFENIVGSGEIVLRIYPVLNNESFSIYGAEALAEAFATNPERAWPFFNALLKESILLEGPEDADTVAAFVANIARLSLGCNPAKPEYCIDSDSIQNATFLSWLYTPNSDPRLNVGYTPPVIYVDGKELDQSIWIINDPDLMRGFFFDLLEK